MSQRLTILSQLAVKASLEGKWKNAIDLNNQILDIERDDISAKNRLGRAYLQLSEFSKAKKCFEEVLDLDPINITAQKNILMAKSRKKEVAQNPNVAKSLIKEPGTTTEEFINITAKRITSESLKPGEALFLKVDKKTASVIKLDLKQNPSILLGKIEGPVAVRLFKARNLGASLIAHFLSGNGKTAKIMVRSSIPVFKSERQEIKPYMKKGTIEEPEIEIPTLEEL